LAEPPRIFLQDIGGLMSSILTGMEAEHKEKSHQLNGSRMHTDTRKHQEMSTFVLCKEDQKSSNIRTDMYVNVDFTTVLNFPCEFKCIFSYYEGFVINESASVADLPPGFLVPPPHQLVPELVAEFGWQRMVL